MKITQQFCISRDNYLWLLEEMHLRKRKNLSRTLDEILKNYQYMIRSLQTAQKKQQLDQKRIKEINEFKNAYKEQIKEGSNEVRTKQVS